MVVGKKTSAVFTYELSNLLLEQMASLVLIQPQGGWLPDGLIHT